MIATATQKDKPSSSRVVTGDLVLARILRDSDGTATAIGKVDCEPFSIPCSAADLQSFARFQAKLFAAVGMWPRHDAEVGGQTAAAYWRDDVARAMEAGAAR